MRPLFSALVILSAVCFSCQFADAGVLTYNAGSGGTFDPSSASAFTFTNFGQGGVSGSVTYTKVRVFARWNGTAPLPAGGITISPLATNFSTSSLGVLTIPGGANANDEFINSGDFVALSTTVTTANLSSVSLAATIPSISVADGFSLQIALQFSNASGSNQNLTSYQTVTAFNSSAVPEPGTYAAGLIVTIAAAIVRRRRRQTVSA